MNLVISMKKYDEYQELIKPIEKKYNRLLLLYSHFKWKFLKKKIDNYNKILNSYYQYLLQNKDLPDEIFKDKN